MRFSPLILGLSALALWAQPAAAQDAPSRDDPTAPVVRTPSLFPDRPAADDPSAPPARAPSAFPDVPTADDPSAPAFAPAPSRPAPSVPSARDVLPQRASAVTPASGPLPSARDVLPARSTPVVAATGPRRPAREVLAEARTRHLAMREQLRSRTAPPAVAVAVPEALSAPTASATVGEALAIDGPWPNPVQNRARLTVTAPADGRARVAVFDVRGREVLVAFDDAVSAGRPVSVALDVGRLATGTYLVVLDAAGARQSRTIQVVR